MLRGLGRAFLYDWQFPYNGPTQATPDGGRVY